MTDNQVVKLLIALHNAPESLFGATLDYIRRCTGKDGTNWQKLHQSVVDAGLGAVVTKAIAAPATPSNVLTVDDHLAKLIALGQYGYANPLVVEYRTIIKDGFEVQEQVFPHDPSETGKWKWSFWSPPRWMSTDDVLDAVKEKGLTLAKVRQLAAFGAAHPNEQMSGPIIGLGSVCQVDGRSYSPGLWGGGGKRMLYLYNLNVKRNLDYRFLCVEPTSLAA